jgi:hypothetical protein
MTHERKDCPSRRTILIGAAVAAGTVSRAQAQPNFKQEDVMYQTKPKDGQRCSLCANFAPPHACQLVQGKISPNAWCQLYVPKT